MALIRKPNSAAESKQFTLRDYLRDDLSSCSSSGFRTYPRRRCCTTVRCLLETDLKSRDSSTNCRDLRRSRLANAAFTTLSALQRASDAIIKAFKHFSSPRVRKSILPRNLSRKLLRGSFRRKADTAEPDIRLLRLSDEKRKPSEQTTGRSPAVANRFSTTGEFTSEISRSPKNEAATENGVVTCQNSNLGEMLVSERVRVPTGEDSPERATTLKPQATAEWSSEEGIVKEGIVKEQRSPVSVLDCPFEDEIDEDTSSPSQCSLGGTEQIPSLTQKKIGRLHNLVDMEPLDLRTRFEMSDLQDGDGRPQPCSTPARESQATVDEEQRTDQGAHELLRLIKQRSKPKSIPSAAENLLLDLFKEKMEDKEKKTESDLEAVKMADDWVMGRTRGLLVEWEVEEGRAEYMSDMEKSGRWRKFGEEKEEVGRFVEAEVWTVLMNQLLADLL